MQNDANSNEILVNERQPNDENRRKTLLNEVLPIYTHPNEAHNPLDWGKFFPMGISEENVTTFSSKIFLFTAV